MLQKLLAKHRKTVKRSVSLLLCLVLLLSTWGTMVAFATTEGTADESVTAEAVQVEEVTEETEEVAPAEEVAEVEEAEEAPPAEEAEAELAAETAEEVEEEAEDEIIMAENRISVAATYASTNVATVYVYVSGFEPTTKVAYSDEMLALLNISTRQSDGYYAVGTISVDTNLLSGNYNSALKTTDDWAIILEALEDLDTSASLTEPDNNIKDYLDMIIQDLGASSSSGYSGMWVVLGSPTSYTWSSGGRVYYNGSVASTLNLGTHAWHLDLRFSAVTITYKYGNNGLSTDGTTAGSKVFITGSTMDYTPTIEAPTGYKIVGYYSDAACTVEWNAINQPINEDTTVYIKIVEESYATVYYQVAEGQGSVSVDNESFNPTTGTAKGSTATAATGWEFVGWYSDAACTDLVSTSATYVPTASWTEGANYHYYAKFVQNTVTVDLTKIITGNMADLTKEFTFTVEYVNASNETVTERITLGNNSTSKTLTVIMNSTVTITEEDYAPYTVTATVNGVTVNVSEGTLSFTAGVNTSVTVTNTYTVVPDTGILLDASPYVMLLSAAGLCIMLCLSKKKLI